MGSKDSEGSGRDDDRCKGGSVSGRTGAGTGPGRTQGGGRDGDQGGRGTGSGKRK